VQLRFRQPLCRRLESSGLQVSIVIPVYNALGLATQCVQSVFDHAARDGSELSFEIIVVDNGSTPDVEAWLIQEQREHTNLRYLRYAEPLGFARSVNAGAAAATGEVLIVLNSDTLVTPGWMDALYRELLADPSLGALTPSTNHAGEPAQMDYSTIDLSAAKALAAVAKRAAAKPLERAKVSRMLYLPQRLTFFCVGLRRSVWNEFGGLDETYRVGNFEDDDLCLRLRVAGYRLGVALDVFVYHHNNATFSANRISHGSWMSQNAVTFAEHARRFSESDATPAQLWPKRPGHEITVVILAGEGPLQRTLLSLANQTVADFEVILPGASDAPTRSWVAYVAEGDILYPFHLEALQDALERNGGESIYADGWVRGGEAPVAHPDAVRLVRRAPLMLAGWMHHVSLHRELLWEESMPMHWPRLTWEMQKAPATMAHPSTTDGPARRSGIDVARSAYRRLVPLETRLGLDRSVRRIIRRPLPDPEQVQMQKLAAHLEALTAEGVDSGRFAVEHTLPAIFMFNAVGWNTIVQRQHHFARGLAERGHSVFWIETTLSPPRNWWTSRPLQQLAPDVYQVRLPGTSREIYTMEWSENGQASIVEAMTAALVQTASAYGVQKPIALVNYPRWQPLVRRLRERGWKIVKDCLDDQRALAGIYQTVLGSYEDWLVEHADLLLTSSVVLQERLRPRASILLQNATDYELFSSATSGGVMQDLPRPVIGFFGALANWLDMELIRAAALRFPKWSFVYIGPQTFSHGSTEVEWLRSTDLPNIHVLPQMEPRKLAAHLAEFDVCTIPFQDIPATRSMNPVKVYEYLAAGKPVVSRDLPEVRYMAEGEAAGLISLYRTPQEFFEQLQSAIANDSPERRQRRQAFARANDWDHRVDRLSGMLVEMGKQDA
jgi:GT2 family glycosyltransferase/glycosyltransferase involved in cell wall biosynthesis